MTASKGRRERKLPTQQLCILAVCRFAEPISSTSLFPYLPEMVKSFGVAENEIGKWAGFCAAVFSLSQAVMGIPWGRFSDIYGRKPAILLGLTSTMLTSLMWGFSKNLPTAIVARALAGAGNGNVGIIRTVVAEMVPFKELQPRAFSIMPLVWNVGSIFGPTIGGALANPLNVAPGEYVSNPSLFERFPYLLPNLVSAIFFMVGITTGFLFLEETLETLSGRRDIGLVLGHWFANSVTICTQKSLEALGLRRRRDEPGHETEPLLKASKDDEQGLPIVQEDPPPAPPSFREVMTRQSVLNLVVYTLLAMHTMAYDQLLPVYMQYPSVSSGNPAVTKPFTDGNPLKFAGGFTLDHFSIGLISTCYGVCGMLIQFFIFPPVARRLGILYCLKWCVCVFPFGYFIMPFTALLPTQQSQVAACFAVMILKCFCGIFAYPCSTILITNSASSLRVLGTLNGFATSVAAVGRAAGPALGGAIFTAGVKHGYIIAPWWSFSALSIIAAIPVFWLEEGEGFGGDDEVSDEEEVEEEVLEAEALETQDGSIGHSRPTVIPDDRPRIEEEEEEDEEHAYGGVGDLGATITRTTTASSTALSESDGDIAARSRSGSQPAISRRGSRRITRPMSIPVGMGNQGISRRYSSNLGQSFGSTGSYFGH